MRRRLTAGALAALALAAGCAAPTAIPPAQAAGPQPSAREVAYLAGFARTIYRGRTAERTSAFLGDGSDLRICIRSPVPGGYDHTLLTLQRRITEDFVSQAADDTLIERSREGVRACRDAANRWIALR